MILKLSTDIERLREYQTELQKIILQKDNRNEALKRDLAKRRFQAFNALYRLGMMQKLFALFGK